MTEPTKPGRRGRYGDPRADTEIARLRAETLHLRAAAGVPDGADHDQACRYLTHLHRRLDLIGVLAVAWEPHAAVGVTLAPDYQRGRACAYREAITELRAALGWPDKP